MTTTSIEVIEPPRWRFDMAELRPTETITLFRELRAEGLPAEHSAEELKEFAGEAMCIVAVILARRDDRALKVSAWRDFTAEDIAAIEFVPQPDLEDPADPTAAA